MCDAHYRRYRRGCDLAAPINPQVPRFTSPDEAFRYYMPGQPPPKGVPWLWTGSVTASGYGRVKVGRRYHRAHRLSWQIFRGPIPAGIVVMHALDIPLDVNPYNLGLGTTGDNTRDAMHKGRMTRGERHHSARLDAARVAELRGRAAAGESIRALAREYAISDTSARRAIDGTTWKHVT